MSLISKTVMVRWNNSTKKHYESLGYKYTKINEWFEVDIKDLIKTSTIKVTVSCDYCDEVFEKPYRKLFNTNVDKICCKNRKCMIKKSQEVSVLKYGVTHPTKLESSKKKSSERNRHSIDYVLETARSKSLTILNIGEYENDRSRLLVLCNKHSDYGVQDTNFSNIKKNKHCCKYIRNENDSKKLDGQVVYDEFTKRDFTPLFLPHEYDNNYQPLPYICNKHADKGVQFRQYSNLKYANGCKYCRSERYSNALLLDEDYVFGLFEDKGLTVLEGEKYNGKEKHIKYICNKHDKEIQQTTYASLKNSNNVCKFCRNELSINNISRNLRSSISQWRMRSEEICDYKCVLTGSKDYDIHHLISFKTLVMESIIEEGIELKEYYSGTEIEGVRQRLIAKHNELMGVCLDKKLHIKFHQLYGKNNNTIEQFEEFKNNYLSGELALSVT